MKEVGDKFGSGELILPFVLKSAECMKAAVGELEKYLLKEEGTSKGKTRTCLRNRKDNMVMYMILEKISLRQFSKIMVIPSIMITWVSKFLALQKFLEKIDEVKPDAVGLSALLVSTSKQMQFFVEHESEEMNMDIPIMCGGAAINRWNYINRIAKQDGIYE